MLQVLDAAALRRWCGAGLEALTAAREEIDDLNVYPVPDGDTGINLQLTMTAVAEALLLAPADLASTVKAMVTGSLMGARGNSGVILSQLLRGLGDVIGSLERVTAEDLRAGLLNSASSAYGAVAVPVEGTVLTVAREAAEGARGTDLAGVVRTAREAGAAALARTPDQLPQLKAAGVVDAGGRGWCVLLEALEWVVTGVVLVEPAGEQAGPGEPALVVPRDRSALIVARESGSATFAYEVQFLLRETSEQAVETLKESLGRLGDSLVVVGGDDLFNVHVHVNDVGAAIEAGVEAGRPFRITVTRFEDQIAKVLEQGRAIIAVAPGEGMARLFRDVGAQVVEGGPTANPSTAELLAAVRNASVGEVVLLPNDGNVRAVATSAAEQARLEGFAVAVIPTRSVLQGLAAVSVADPRRVFDDEVAAMGAAAGATRWAEVTTAVRPSSTAAGPCEKGDSLGLLEGEVVFVGSDVEEAARHLLHRMLDGGGELATIVLGGQAASGAGERLTTYLREMHPAVEALVLEGGQPHYPFLLGVE